MGQCPLEPPIRDFFCPRLPPEAPSVKGSGMVEARHSWLCRRASLVALVGAVACGGRTGDEESSGAGAEAPSDRSGDETPNGSAPVPSEGAPEANTVPLTPVPREGQADPDRARPPREREPEPPPPADDSEQDPPAVVNPEPVPCGAPGEAGCGVCCMGVEFGCVQLSSSAPETAGSTYDRREHLEACPVSCRPCSSCYGDVESFFADIVGRSYSECDCNGVNTSLDPCFAPYGCTCACSAFRSVPREICQ
jgi:hypothetical protein